MAACKCDRPMIDGDGCAKCGHPLVESERRTISEAELRKDGLMEGKRK